MKNFIQAIIFAIQFLTRLPVPVAVEPNAATVRKALMSFPLVGWLLGVFLFGLCELLTAMRFSPLTAAIMIVIAETLITGAFHLDGLADTFDALGSPGTNREDKLAIMQDSRIGVMGATALILSLLFKTFLICEILRLGLFTALLIYPAIGRWSQIAAYYRSPYVRKAGIGSMFSRHADSQTLALSSLWLAPCLPFPRFPIILLLSLPLLYLYLAYFNKKIGGITGDVLGSITVLSEIYFLFGALLFNQ